eukprot:12742546-Heterocapsa_arctica.AAC.1
MAAMWALPTPSQQPARSDALMLGNDDTRSRSRERRAARQRAEGGGGGGASGGARENYLGGDLLMDVAKL